MKVQKITRIRSELEVLATEGYKLSHEVLYECLMLRQFKYLRKHWTQFVCHWYMCWMAVYSEIVWNVDCQWIVEMVEE